MDIWTIQEEADRLKARFAGVNRAEFARTYEIKGKDAYIYQHITARRPITLDAALAYAKGFGVTLEEISPRLASEIKNAIPQIRESTTAEEINLVDNPDYPAVRRVKLHLSAGISGFGVEMEEESHTPLVFGRYWYQSRGFKPEKLIAVRVKGASMEPGMGDSDTVVINTADITPADGEVFAVNYEGEAVVKRMVRDAGEWWLSSDNPDQRRYARKLCVGDACIIIGRIVHKQSERI